MRETALLTIFGLQINHLGPTCSNNGHAAKLIANIVTHVSLDDPTPTATCPLHHTVAMTLITLDSMAM